MFFFTYTAFFLALVCLGIATFIWSRKPKDIMARYFVLYLYAVTLWIGSNAFADLATTRFTNILWSGCAFIGVNFFVSYYLCFTHVFVFNKRPGLIVRTIYFLPTIFFSLSAFSKYSIADTIFPQNAPSSIVPGPFYRYYLYFYFASVIYGFALLVWFSIRKANKQERRQALFMGIGSFILFVSSVFFGSILPVFFNELRFFNVGPQFVIFLIAFSSYAILRHRLFDIQLLIKKGAVFTILLAIVLLLLNSLITVTSVIFPGIWSQVIPAIIITAIFSPLKNWLERITDKIFFRRHHSFAEMVRMLNKALEAVNTPSDFVKNTGNFLSGILKVDKMGFLIADEQGLLRHISTKTPGVQRVDLPPQSAILAYFTNLISRKQDPLIVLDKDDLEYRSLYESLPEAEKMELSRVIQELKELTFHTVVPFVNNDKILGFVFLGAKQSGDQISEPDFRILESLAHEGSNALQNAISAERTLRLNELKSEFIRVVSHQLRTPLSAARWNTDLVLDQKLSRSLTGPMSDIQINLAKISDGLTSMLTVMEIAEEKIDVKKSDVDVADLINSAVKNFTVLADKRKIKIQLEIDPKKIIAQADVDKIRKSINVLIGNALMYSPEKSRVTIHLSKDANDITFAIEDNGMGVAKQDREEIFQKFFRGEEAKRMSPDGLGVNLYLARDFISRHGGQLWVEDRQDGKSGARFVFTLPLK